MFQRAIEKEKSQKINFRYQLWTLDKALARAVWLRDKRCCRCHSCVPQSSARVARITNPNNLNNRFNLDLVALCCPYCEEYCVIETEYALFSVFSRLPDLYEKIERKQLRFEELTADKLSELKKAMMAQIKADRDFRKNLLTECRELMK